MSNCPICNNPIKTGLKTCGNKECIIKLRKKTCIQRYGVEVPSQNPIFIEKSKQTCLRRHGVDNIFQNKEYIKKCVEKKYEVSNPNYIKVGKERKNFLRKIWSSTLAFK